MKKLLCAIILLSLGSTALKAQDDSDKKVKMGIAITPAINWLTPNNDKKMTNDGSALKMGIGLVADFRLTNVIWFHTGLEYTGVGGKLGYKASDTAGYYYKDDAIVESKPSEVMDFTSKFHTDPSYVGYRLLQRKYKVGYIHIPLGFKLKTNELGGITYYGQIGADLFIRTSAKGDDHVSRTVSGSTTESDLTNNKLPGSTVNLINSSVHVGFGGEYRLSGSTAITASIQYRHGIMNFTNNGTDYLVRSSVSNGTFSVTQFPNDAKLRQVVLTLGVMF